MATPNQRAVIILEALLNTSSTLEQRNRLLAAYGSSEAWLKELFLITKNRIKHYENLTAKEATDTAVDADFTEL